jgi:hypothetical protein
VEVDPVTRIRQALVTGDNHLKHGGDPARARMSYERALTLAREAGLEDTIAPLVELRLADLGRLETEDARPDLPDG